MTNYYGGQGGGRGIPLQWIIGIIIAIGGFIAYFSHTTVNPTTGEKQRVSLTADQEIALGMESAPQMAQEMGGEVPPSDPQAREVQYIGNRIWKRSEAAMSPYPFHYHLLADRKMVNAFALPGGEVFITKGLLDRLSTEGEVAGVLGHESGHVVERHVAQQMAQGDLGKYLVTAVGVASSADRHGMSQTMIASVVNRMTQLHFSRNDESQADEAQWQSSRKAG